MESSTAGKADGGNGGSSKPKSEKAATREYAVLGAIGESDAKVDGLDFKVIARVEAATPGAAKGVVLDRDPEFPGGGPGQKLSALVQDKRLWLHAESGFNPKQVVVEQPPPVYKGL